MKLREVEKLPGATWLVGGRVGFQFLVYATAELWTFSSGFWGLYWPQKWFPRERCCVMPEMKWIKGSFSVTAPASYRFFFLISPNHSHSINHCALALQIKKKKKKFTARTLLSEWTKGYSSSQESFCAKKDKEIQMQRRDHNDVSREHKESWMSSLRKIKTWISFLLMTSMDVFPHMFHSVFLICFLWCLVLHKYMCTCSDTGSPVLTLQPPCHPPFETWVPWFKFPTLGIPLTYFSFYLSNFLRYLLLSYLDGPGVCRDMVGDGI